MPKACFLDRDGVINKLVERKYKTFTSPWNIFEYKFFPNVFQALTALKKQNFLLFIVTNQPGIEDGDMKLCDLKQINDMLLSVLPIDEIKCALNKKSLDYKPNNSMIECLISKYNIERNKSFLVGDRWKDIVPAKKSNLTAIFVGENYSSPEEYIEYSPDFITNNIFEASEIILRSENVI